MEKKTSVDELSKKGKRLWTGYFSFAVCDQGRFIILAH